MAMTDEFWTREGWEIPGSDDEMEYDLTKCIDSKLTACFDALTKQKTLKVSAAMYARPTVPSLQTSYDSKDPSLISEPPKHTPEENDSSIFDTFDYHEDKGSENIRKRSYPPGASKQASKKATLGNVMNNMMRHKRLENMGGRPQLHMMKNNMYAGVPGESGPFPGPIRHPPRSASVQDITQNVMAQSRSINESIASLNMPARNKNMPMTTPQPTPLGQPIAQGMEVPRSPNISSPSPGFNNMSPMSHLGARMGPPPPNQTMMSPNMMMRGVMGQEQRSVPSQPGHFPIHSMGDPIALQQQQQQMYQRMSGGMYPGPQGLTLVQGNNMGPRMVYNPVSGQTIMTTQHSGAMMAGAQAMPGNNSLASRSGMMGAGGGMIPGMGPAPPNMSAASLVQNQAAMPQKMMADNCQLVVSQAMQHPGVMMGSPSVPPNHTVSNFPSHLSPSSMAHISREMQLAAMARESAGGMSRGGGVPSSILSPDNKPKLNNKISGLPVSSSTGMMPPPMSPAGSMVSPTNSLPPVLPGNRTPQQRTPPSNVSPVEHRDNITLNTAVAEPLAAEDSMNPA